MSEETCTWTGVSGTTYIFYVYPRPPEVPSRPGNYIYARQNAEKLWVPTFIGQGDLAVCCEDDQALMDCIDGHAATHLHMRLCSTEWERLAVHADLLGAYKNAFPPDGCNSPEDAPPT